MEKFLVKPCIKLAQHSWKSGLVLKGSGLLPVQPLVHQVEAKIQTGNIHLTLIQTTRKQYHPTPEWELPSGRRKPG